ncbi:plasmid mobilization relaxosome protein MobC [Anaerocolumna sp. AGMB13020]|uniref:plasmid mobilization protein n=1 Tax=Anaerocolumna sp. AGMB13020 TaxID=3081750 RepID=UPI00295588CB|nr:plasmid mobilization relaxosome protein MobC [Anaerocolumna sp. AGMB13020]WOO35760.1 plasmid mobilization relaxosome protein MobC [Anaerocolumna sp. AGMB13020]
MEEKPTTKIKRIEARATLEQKIFVKRKAKEAGMKECEYVLYCCLKDEMPLQSPAMLEKIMNSDPESIHIRVTAEEKKQIIEKYKISGINNLSRFVRLCCQNKQIIVINDLKVLAKELHKVGNNLNQITMLCHQGLIQTPDITETKDNLSKVYQELVKLNKKVKPGR